MGLEDVGFKQSRVSEWDFYQHGVIFVVYMYGVIFLSPSIDSIEQAIRYINDRIDIKDQ